jgi:4-hydroxy-tetrahydrodipicolinate reductase|tara:strand:- start:341 stop:1147 length:807 start_codon:yes stop_codon:yes gene_type:complete
VVHNIAITGAGGRMGRALVEALSTTEGVQLTAAIEHSASKHIGADSGELAGLGRNNILVVDSVLEAVGTFDTLIDFSVPESTVHNALVCQQHNKKMVIGTTGLTAGQLATVQSTSDHTAVCMASNFATGVNLCFKLAEIAALALGDDADIEISESHHKHKIDAPSGTALSLGKSVANALGRDLDEVAVYGREDQSSARNPKSIGFSSIRAGDIVGDHTVLFAADGERVEITHKASSRTAFARGAVRAAKWLADRETGMFDMQDVLGLK